MAAPVLPPLLGRTGRSGQNLDTSIYPPSLASEKVRIDRSLFVDRLNSWGRPEASSPAIRDNARYVGRWKVRPFRDLESQASEKTALGNKRPLQDVTYVRTRTQDDTDRGPAAEGPGRSAASRPPGPEKDWKAGKHRGVQGHGVRQSLR